MQIIVKGETSTAVLNEDNEFVCQHDGDTYIDWAVDQGDVENTSRVTICEDCGEIL